MSGPLAKAALVEYSSTWPPAPVVTVFQYNPETMVHAWSQPEPAGRAGVESANPLAVNGMPGESFEFTIFLNADDDLVSGMPLIKQAAQQSGVGARLAALEMLLYPAAGPAAAGRQPTASRLGGLLGTVSAGAGFSGATWKLPNSTVPVVLFYWNSNRIVPVRVTSLSVTETLYDTDLNPINAQAQLSLRVLTPAELEASNPAPGTAAELATVAYNQTLATRRLWAIQSTGAAAASIASKLPN
jgi:hypothetical protein